MSKTTIRIWCTIKHDDSLVITRVFPFSGHSDESLHFIDLALKRGLVLLTALDGRNGVVPAHRINYIEIEDAIGEE